MSKSAHRGALPDRTRAKHALLFDRCSDLEFIVQTGRRMILDITRFDHKTKHRNAQTILKILDERYATTQYVHAQKNLR